MRRTRIFLRLIILCFSLAIAPAVGAALVFTPLVGGILLGGIAVLVLASGFWVEGWVKRRVGRGRLIAPTRGLLQTYEFSVLQESKPTLWLYEDPTPGAVVVRGWTGAGSIIMSQGLISGMDELELRRLIGYCAQICREPETSLHSVVAWLMSLCFSLAPQAWVNWVWGQKAGKSFDLGEPWVFLACLSIVPWVRWLRRIGRTAAPGDERAHPRELDSAFRKISVAAQRWEYRPDPGLELISLRTPGLSRRLVSL